MRALTVQQPWAWAIVHGGKNIENRTQMWKYRGPLAIHAGQRWSDRGGHSPLVAAACARSWPVPPAADRLEEVAAGIARHGLEPTLYPNSIALAGAIIGVARLVDVHRAEPEALVDGVGTPACCDSPWAEQSYEEHGGRTRRDVVHLVLEDPRPVDPIPCTGRLGLWTPTQDILEQLAEGCR